MLIEIFKLNEGAQTFTKGTSDNVDYLNVTIIRHLHFCVIVQMLKFIVNTERMTGAACVCLDAFFVEALLIFFFLNHFLNGLLH